MISFSTIHWRRRNAATGSHYHDQKKTRRLSRLLQTLKSCFGHGSIEVDVASKSEYRRSSDPATGFGGEEVYGIQAESLDEVDMAWGKPKKAKKWVRGQD